MSKTRVLKQLFSVLCRIQKDWFSMEPRWEIPERTHETLYHLMPKWEPISEKEIESLFSDPNCVEVRLSARHKVLYLPRMEEEPDFLPVLSLECKLDDENDVMKLRLMLVHCGENGGKPHGIGFRMEEGENIHGFYHAQMIKNLEGAATVEEPPIECPLRFPETQPSIPLRAEDSITLVLCLLISLYGIEYCWTLANEHQLSELTGYLKYFGAPN